jgi:hypothetical protein
MGAPAKIASRLWGRECGRVGPSRKREGKPVGENAPGHGWDAALARVRGETRGEDAPGHGWDAALAQARGETRWGRTRRGTVGMQPSREREGKPGGERGDRAQLGCSPRASARGSPLGRAPEHSWDAALAQARGETRWGGRAGAQCSPRASARGSPLGRAPEHGWDAALAQARGETRRVEHAGARLGCSPRASARGNPWRRARWGTVGMQPSRKREGKPGGSRIMRAEPSCVRPGLCKKEAPARQGVVSRQGPV